jgi:hypothetical protein
MTEFYLTLLSNSSMDVFPNNKTGSFTVHLPKAIILEGHWKMAVTECYYQYNFWNVTPDNNTVYFKYKGEQGQCAIQEGFYEKTDDLVNEINKYLTNFLKPGNFLEYNNTSKNIRVNKEVLKILTDVKFENRLALQLGFVPNEAIQWNCHVQTSIPANVANGIPDEMFLYCNLAEPQYFGHELAPIIRILNIPKKNTFYGQPIHTEFRRLQYVDVSKKNLNNITIELREKTGELMPFISGTFTCVLHFRKIM